MLFNVKKLGIRTGKKEVKLPVCHYDLLRGKPLGSTEKTELAKRSRYRLTQNSETFLNHYNKLENFIKK